ncbi:COG4705 family protein [Streptomyces xylophagus]|uniref:COG4705 family protein n=1 Tax=Streptomyces xylophagus TaxID=285514 RepID=UPI0005BBB3DE|nr:hypothetical protein [Streptomyces xylophagus]
MEKRPATMAMKVPEITLIFWIAKLCTTGFGESFSDYVFFNDYIGQHTAMLMGLGLLLVCLAAQITTRKYIPWVYWLAVTAVSIFGTMSADFLNKDLGMPLYASTLMLVTLQIAVFAAWYASQRTLDVHSINNRLRELFYWLTVLCTFALGTAAGDFAAVTLGLGTLASSFVFLGIILIPAAGYRWFRLNEVLAFWFAYTITRPLGASVADWLSVPAPYGDGIQLGTGPISLVLGILLAGVIVLIGSRHRRSDSLEAAPPETAAEVR